VSFPCSGKDLALDDDFILTNVMLYWLTGTAGSSARWYYEDAHSTDECATGEHPDRGRGVRRGLPVGPPVRRP
jgi:hypothetical protein